MLVAHHKHIHRLPPRKCRSWRRVGRKLANSASDDADNSSLADPAPAGWSLGRSQVFFWLSPPGLTLEGRRPSENTQDLEGRAVCIANKENGDFGELARAGCKFMCLEVCTSQRVVERAVFHRRSPFGSPHTRLEPPDKA